MTHDSASHYSDMYARSLAHPDLFWDEQAKKYINWFEPWDNVLSGDFDRLGVQWFQGAKLNAAYNCLDRHLPHRADQPAIIWKAMNQVTRLF